MMKYVMLIAFFAVMVAVGVYCKRRAADVNGFLLGGRNVGAWFSAFAYGTSYFSAVIFVGYAGKFGFQFGTAVVWVGIGNAIIGSLAAWLLFANRTREMTHRLDSKTMPEFFAARYGSHAMEIVAAIITFVFLIPYSASVYQGISYLFESTFGIPFVYCMIAMAVLTAAYIFLGGYMATAINDFIQGIIMVAGVLMVVYCVISNQAVGGLTEGLDRLTAMDPALTSIVGKDWFGLLSVVLLTSLGTWGLPQMAHKFYAIRDKKAIRQGTVISTVFALVLAGSAYFIGSFGRLYFSFNNTEIPANLDEIMPKMLSWALGNSEWLLGLVVVLVLAASMSTLSSLVLAASSTISVDIVGKFLRPKSSKKSQLLCMRVFCLLFVLISLVVANLKGPIATLMSYSWGGLAGAFIAPYLYGIRWKGTTKAGAWAGFIVGIGVTVAGIILVPMKLSSYITPPSVGAAAMLLSLLIVPVVSKLTPKLSAEIVDNAFGTAGQKTEKAA